MEDKVIVVQRFDNYLQANAVKARLDSQGIECFLSDEKAANPFHLKGKTVVKLHVSEKDQELTRRILRLDGTLHAAREDGLTRCPKCFSLNVVYAKGMRKKLSYPKKITSVLLKIYPFSSKILYYCFDCGFEFESN
jgi:hypothetical protein